MQIIYALAMLGAMTLLVLVLVMIQTAWLEPRRFRKQRARNKPTVFEARGQKAKSQRLLTMSDLSHRLSLEPDYLRRFVPEYRMVRVQKRRSGWRTLHVPDEPTKRLQQTVHKRLLGRLKSHPAAFGFERGKSIADHAALHSGKAILIKCDLVDFFPSTTGKRVGDFFRRIGWDHESASILTKICCHEGALPQGAPTSPRLSNLVNRGFDRLMSDHAERWAMTYSRYADDLCFSYEEERKHSARHMRGTLQFVRHVARGYGYRMHGPDKTRIARAHRRQLLCGLVVNEKPNLPREQRRKLRAIRHHLANNRPATMTLDQVRGWAAYESMVATPEFRKR